MPLLLGVYGLFSRGDRCPTRAAVFMGSACGRLCARRGLRIAPRDGRVLAIRARPSRDVLSFVQSGECAGRLGWAKLEVLSVSVQNIFEVFNFKGFLLVGCGFLFS